MQFEDMEWWKSLKCQIVRKKIEEKQYDMFPKLGFNADVK